MSITMKCKDGNMQVPELLYNQSATVREFVNSDSGKKWAAAHDMTKVFMELQDLMWR